MNFTVEKLPSGSAADLLERFSGVEDHTLPSLELAENISRTRITGIPKELQVFDLVCPKAVHQGLQEGQGDRVTDDSIAYLVWNGDCWEVHYALAGPNG